MTARAGLTVHVSVNVIKIDINVQWRQFEGLYFQPKEDVNLNWSGNMLYRYYILKEYIIFPEYWLKKDSLKTDIKTLQNSTDTTFKIQLIIKEMIR